MQLKSLEIGGFKSFGKKSSLFFDAPITAVVGPNGSGKCVDGSTLIQLEDGSVISIKELFLKANRVPSFVEQYDDGMAIKGNGSIKVASLNLETLKTEWQPISAFIRRTAPTSMIDITTRSGRVIKATPYHPLFSYVNDRVETLRADAIKIGEKIAVPRIITTEGQLQPLLMFEIATMFGPEEGIYVPYSSALLGVLDSQMELLGIKTTTAFARVCGTPEKVFARLRQTQALPACYLPNLYRGNVFESALSQRVLKSRGSGTMKVPEYLDKEFARFLGYIISEGRVSRSAQVWFVNEEPEIIDDFIDCSKHCFDLEPHVFSYKKGTKDVIIFSKILTKLLDRMFGLKIDGGSRDKIVPPQIFQSPQNVITAFLSALYSGDGYFHLIERPKRQQYIEYSTASEDLARGVATLLLRLGIVALIRKNNKCATNTKAKTKRIYWSVFVYGNEQISRFVEIIKPYGRKRTVAEKMHLLNIDNSNPNLDLLPKNILEDVRSLVKEAQINVKSARKILPLLGAYCERRCLPSRQGVIKILEFVKKNGQINPRTSLYFKRLKTIAESDILWDEIIAIKTENGKDYVYDLTVEGNHNFIANNFFVHNSNIAEAFRWVLGEQSLKSLRGKRGEDLIFSGPVANSRLNRASVSVVFDNADRHFDLDFDEVKITREVFRDGLNEYSINGTVVRLRDILELLSKISLGASGHHIISQGEADRVLTASPIERRTMIEEALGLKLYQWKLDESEKKLAKTEDNKKQVESLRREIAPHLKFLKKQVEKIEKADELRRELKVLYREYLKREKVHIDFWQKKLSGEKQSLLEELRSLDERINLLSQKLHADNSASVEQKKIIEAEQALRALRLRRDEISRSLGRLEGLIEVKTARLSAGPEDETDRPISLSAVRNLAGKITEDLVKAEQAPDFSLARQILAEIRRRFDDFFGAYNRPKEETNLEAEVAKLQTEKKTLENEIESSSTEEKNILAKIAELKQTIKTEEDSTRGAERELFELKTRRGELSSKRGEWQAREETIRREEEDFQREIQEGLVLVDREILMFENEVVSIDEVLAEDRRVQEERRRQVEKVKIRLEDMGAERGDVLEEFKEVTERDTHLEKELGDLEASANSLKQVMLELRTKIDVEFKEGIIKINSAFQQFFAEMFGGGSAKLEVVAPVVRKNREARLLSDDEVMLEMDKEEVVVGKEGIDINVTLPRKKIKGLAMLSGGERALTSIALLFAMSQVNPPPFLILDETDAALDEANSRKYGQMVVNLSKSSQLIVITHNRETMTHAGILYGVTMGSDGVSRLLSIKFDEATAYAK